MLNARSIGSSEIQKVRALLNGKKWNEFYKVAAKKTEVASAINRASTERRQPKSAIENLLEKLKKKADTKQEVSDRYWVKNKEKFFNDFKIQLLGKRWVGHSLENDKTQYELFKIFENLQGNSALKYAIYFTLCNYIQAARKCETTSTRLRNFLEHGNLLLENLGILLNTIRL